MSYNAFLLVMCQLSTRKKAECTIQDNAIFVESKSEGQAWDLSTKIWDADEAKVPSFLEESLSLKGRFNWQEKGAYLKRDKETSHIYLIQEIKASPKYVPFKHLMNDFAQVALEWKNMLG
ncbi:MAG: hypothetical protein NTX49_10000 [Chlamydiae bacterium]|nr:hypothetical protein [Chlamydiota bacterium]